MTTTTQTPPDLAELGRQLRVDAIVMADRAGSGHPTSSMSAADLIAVLIAGHLAIDTVDPAGPGSDRLVFSKGHASPLLYAALAAMGIVDRNDLDRYRALGSRLEGHPTPRQPGVPVATGSLGLGLPMGVGLALAARDLDRSDARTWVLCGDSEMAEGAMWEAIEHAGWAELGNLTAIVDVNRLGQTGPTRHGWDTGAYRRRFEAFGWHVVEVDGHDVDEIDRAFVRAAEVDAPVAVVARTVKGHGADETADAEGKHGKPLDDPDAAIDQLGGRRNITVTPRSPVGHEADRGRRAEPWQPPTWAVGDEVPTRDAFGAALVALGRSRPELVALDGEVANSTRLEGFEDALGDRFFEMYIAEQLMASVAIGMDAGGWRPVAATFAAFWTRAHDVLRMATIGHADLCVVGSHAGVSIGEDGPSQMGLEDLAMMRSLHGSTVVHPCDANQTAALLPQLVDRRGISYLRVLRGATPVVYEPGTEFAIGGSHVLRRGDLDRAVVVAAGATVVEASEAAERLAADGIDVRVLDAYSIEPLDAEAVVAAAEATGAVVVVEDHHPEGGLGEAVAMALAESSTPVPLRHLAVRIMPGSATPAEQRTEAGIDADAIAAEVVDLVGGGR